MIYNNKNLKIVFFEPRYDDFYGAQKSMYTLVANIDKNKYTPIVVTTAEGKFAQNFRNLGLKVDVISLSPLVNVFGKKILKYSLWKKIVSTIELLKYNLKIYKWLKSNKINMVYANDIRAILYTALAAKFYRIPIIWYVRVDERLGVFFSISVVMVDKIITIADGVRRAFKKKEMIKYRHKFTTLYTGFDFDNIINSDLEKENIKNQSGIPPASKSKVIGLVGSITPRKGHHLLVQSASKIISRVNDVYFLFVGDVPSGYENYKQEIVQKIEDLGLSDKFYWTGYVQDIASIYKAIDVLVLPSRSEGLPRTIIEGLAAGLPVVACDVGGVKEIIVSEQLGRVIPIDNSEKLGEAVIDILKDSKYKKNKENRKDYVKSKFSIESYISGFDCIIESMRS